MKLKDLVEVIEINQKLKIFFDRNTGLNFDEGVNEARRNNFLNSYGDREVDKLYAWEDDVVAIELRDKKGE